MMTYHDGTGPRAVEGDVHGHPGVVLYDSDGNEITSFGGGGGGGAVTVADGADVAQGAKGDTAITDPSLSASEIALLKGLLSGLGATGDAATANTAIGRLKKLISLFPSAIGQTTKSGSLSAALASDDDLVVAVGAKADAAAGSDSATASLIALVKRLLGKQPPLGAATAANSTPVTLANDGVFAVNHGLTTDAESSSGNASAIAILKRLRTLLNGGLPAALGQTTKSASLPVVLPSDYQTPILPTNATPSVTSVTGNNADMVASMDVSNYRGGVLVLSGFGSATVQVQVSGDGGTTWVAVPTKTVAPSSNSGIGVVSLTASGTYFFALPGAGLMRIRTTAYSSGTIAGALQLTTVPPIDLFPFSILLNGTAVNDNGTISPQGMFNYAGNSAHLATPNFLFNGTNWDRQRNVNALSVIASAAKTTDQNSADQTNYNWRGMLLILNVSAQSGGSVKLAVQVKDSISGNYVTVWTATAAQTAVGTYTYLLYPSNLDAASWTEKAALTIGRTWRIATSTANGSSITYSVSADMLL